MSGRHIHRIDELARDLPPSRDLWPAIQAGIAAASVEDQAARSAPPARRRAAWLPVAGLAAGVALLAVGVLIGRSMAPDTGALLASTPAADSAAAPGLLPAALRDAEYRRQRDALVAEVQVRLREMPEAEREKVAASLNTLQRSIREIEAALGRDPANALLQELLVSSCQEEMRALTAVRDTGRQEI